MASIAPPLDAYSEESVKRAQAAITSGAFKDEIVPVTVKGRKGDVVIDTDEEPGKIDPSKIPTLRAAFGKDGVITAASSSKISDGAAATVLMSADEAAKRGLKPLARIVAHATHSQEPEWFTTAPVNAIDNVLKKAGWNVADVDLFEVNEAFACVAMAPMKDLGIPHEKTQRAWRRLRTGPSDRRQRCAPGSDPDQRAAPAWRQARRGFAVHWRRRSHGDCHRNS